MGIHEEFDEAAFDASFAHVAEVAAAAAGFPTSRTTNQLVNDRVRQIRLQHKAYAARELVTDIQQWLVDDSREVRALARTTVRELLRALYLGDEDDSEPTPPERGRVRVVLERWGARLSAVDPDARLPWWREAVGQRRIRWVLNALVLVFGAATAWAVATANPYWALFGLAATIAVDRAETVYTKIVRNRSVDQRWLACVASQVADTLMLTGIAVSFALVTRPLVAAGVVTAIFISVTGSFIRVSALQAGHRIWLSVNVRVVRWAAVGAYSLALIMANLHVWVAVVAAVSVGLTGLWEAGNAIWRVMHDEETKTANVVVIDADNHVEKYPVTNRRVPDSELNGLLVS